MTSPRGSRARGRSAPRTADARNRGLRRPRLLGPRDARAEQRRDSADHALPGHEDRSALLLPAQLSRREPLWLSGLRLSLPGSARAHGESLVEELPPLTGVSATVSDRAPGRSVDVATPRPRRAARRCRCVVLVMHGGAVDGHEPNQAVVAQRRSARALRPRAAQGAGAAGRARVRFRFRGWNGDEQAPRRGRQVGAGGGADGIPRRPVAVVGHSMGGRVALHRGEEPDVRLVVGARAVDRAGRPRPGAWSGDRRHPRRPRRHLWPLPIAPARRGAAGAGALTRGSSGSRAVTTRCSCGAALDRARHRRRHGHLRRRARHRRRP